MSEYIENFSAHAVILPTSGVVFIAATKSIARDLAVAAYGENGKWQLVKAEDKHYTDMKCE